MNSFHLLVHTRLYELGAEWEAAAAKFHESYVALGNKVITDDEFVSLSVLPVATICNQICFLQDGLKESGATGPALLMVLEKDTIKYSVISLLLDLLSDSHKDKRFKIACLRCVTSVTKACGSPTTISKIFPGVSTAVFKICVGDFKQGKELTALAIESWTQITSIAMSDDALSCFSEEQVAEVKAKVRVMAENVFSFKFGPPLLDSYCVRLALVRSAVLLLESCCTGLKECTELFLDTIVLYNNIESDPSSSSISTKEEGPNGGNEVVRITEDAIEKMSQKILEKKSKKEGSTSESDVLAYLSSLEENAENASQPEEFGTENDFSFAEDRLYSLLSSLPRLNLSTLNDEKKLDTVRLVNGYIKLLSGSLSSLVPVLLDRIALTLISLLEFDVALPSDAGAKAGNVTIWKRPLQQQQSGGIGLSFSGARTSFLSATRYPRHEFRFFGDMRIALELKKMCSLLAGLSGDDNATALVSSFLELYADTKNHKVKNQIIYILIGTVEGIRQELLTETLVSALVENVLEATLENFTTCNSSPFYDTLFSLVSELFGKLYMRASLDTLSAMLPKVLYPLLELLGEGMMNKNSKTLDAIWVALNAISYRLYSKKHGEGITLLIKNNMDYVVDQISRRISCSYKYPRVPFIFSALLQLTGESFLPFLEDTLNQIFRSLERRERATTRPFIFILRDIVRCFASKMPCDSEGDCCGSSSNNNSINNNGKATRQETTKGSNDDGTPSRKSIIHDIREHQRYRNGSVDGQPSSDVAQMSNEEKAAFYKGFFDKKAKEHKGKSEGSGDEDGGDGEEGTSDVGEEGGEAKEEKRDMPKLMMTKRILETCIHHLGSKDLAVKLAALDAISKAIVVMDREGGNVPNADDGQVILWPLLHQCWEPLCLRLEDSDKSVSLKALDVLRVISVHSGGFLSQRISTNALPRFVERIGALAPKASEYTFMWTSKEKEAIMGCLVNLYKVADPTPQHAYKMTAALLPFLSESTPYLADLAMEVITRIGRTNADAVWLVLVKYDGKRALPSYPVFDRLPPSLKKIPEGWPQPSSVSTKRVGALLAAL